MQVFRGCLSALALQALAALIGVGTWLLLR